MQTFSGTLNASGTFQIGGVTVALPISLANGGTNNASLTASNGGIVWSDATKLNVLAGTVTAGQCLLSGSSAAPSWGVCASAAVNSVGNAAADTSLTIAGTGTGPWTGSVTVKLNLANAQTWTAIQTFANSTIKLLGSSTGVTTFTSANAGVGNFTLTFPAVTDTLAVLGTAQTFTAAQTFANSSIKLLGSSTGATTFTSANAGASNFTITVPAVTDTLAVLGTNQTFTATQTFSGTLNASGTFQSSGNAMTFPGTAQTLAGLGTAQTWTAVQTFTNSDIKLLGSSTGGTTFTSANAGASNFTITVPAVTDTLAVLGTNQTFTATQTFSGTLNASGTFQSSGNAMTFPGTAQTLAGLGTAQTWTAVQTFTNSDIKLLRFQHWWNHFHVG